MAQERNEVERSERRLENEKAYAEAFPTHLPPAKGTHVEMILMARALGIVTALIGVMVLFCFNLGQPGYRWFAAMTSLQLMPAAGFVMAGLAIFLQCWQSPRPRMRTSVKWLRTVMAAVILLGAVYALCALAAQNWFGYVLDPRVVVHPHSALSFILLSLAMLFCDHVTPTRRYPAEYLACILLALNAIPLIGYLYGDASFAQMAYSEAIPSLAAFLFLLTAVSMLMSRPSHRIMAIITQAAPGGQMLRRSLPQMLVLLIVLNWLVEYGAREQLYGRALVAPLLTLLNCSLVLIVFWRVAARVNEEYGARMESAAKLAETTALLVTVSDNTDDLIFVKNRLGQIIFANPATLQQIGKSWEDTLHRSNRELFPDQEDADALDREEARIMATGLPAILEQTLHVPRGVFTYQTTIAPWFDKDGNVMGVVGISTDITERKLAEDSLRERELSLEKTVTERTALLRELTNHLETVREEEKRSIARELHDNMGAALTALSMHMEMVYKVLPPDEKWAERKTRMQTTLTSLVNTTRRIQTELRPNMLDLFGLKAAITEQLDELSERSGLICHASLPDEDVEIGPQMEIALYRMLQEILNNITKHAQATKVDVILDIDEDHVALTVRDNGIGMTQERKENTKSYGLRGLRERAVYFGGTIDIRSSAEKGTVIAIALPISPTAVIPEL